MIAVSPSLCAPWALGRANRTGKYIIVLFFLIKPSLTLSTQGRGAQCPPLNFIGYISQMVDPIYLNLFLYANYTTFQPFFSQFVLTVTPLRPIYVFRSSPEQKIFSEKVIFDP